MTGRAGRRCRACGRHARGCRRRLRLPDVGSQQLFARFRNRFDDHLRAASPRPALDQERAARPPVFGIAGSQRPQSEPRRGTPPDEPQPSTVRRRCGASAGERRLGEQPVKFSVVFRRDRLELLRAPQRAPPRRGRRRPARCARRDAAPAPGTAHRSRPGCGLPAVRAISRSRPHS